MIDAWNFMKIWHLGDNIYIYVCRNACIYICMQKQLECQRYGGKHKILSSSYMHIPGYTYILKHMKCFLLSDNFNFMVGSFKDGFLFYNPVIRLSPSYGCVL